MSFQKKRKFCDSLLSCLDETNIAVVHKLTKKVLDAASHDCVEADDIPCRGTLRNYSLRLLKTLGTDMDVPLSGGGSMKITVIRPQEAIPYLLGRSFQSQVTRMKEYPPRYFLGGLVNPQPVCDEDSAALRVYALLPFTTSVQVSLKAKVRG